MIPTPCCKQELPPEKWNPPSVPPVKNKPPPPPPPPVQCCVPGNVNMTIENLSKVIKGTFLWDCQDNNCSNGGWTKIVITLEQPAPKDLTLLFAQVYDAGAGRLRSGDNIIPSIPAGTLPDSYFGNYYRQPFEIKIPRGTTSLQVGGPDTPILLQGVSNMYNNWICHTCNSPVSLLWVKMGDQEYNAAFTLTRKDKDGLTAGATLTNVPSNNTKGNRLMITFVPCGTINQYLIKYRQRGSASYTTAGVYGTPPVTLYDSFGNTDTLYDISVQAISENGACDAAYFMSPEVKVLIPKVTSLYIHAGGYTTDQQVEAVVSIDRPALDDITLQVLYSDFSIMGGAQITLTVTIQKGQKSGTAVKWYGNKHPVVMPPFCIVKVISGQVLTEESMC
jgi:hypothetical protein